MIEFDPQKDAANLAKHGISLGMARKMTILAIQPDPHPGEQRWRAFGYIEDRACCFVFTEREGRLRAISLRRSHKKEFRRYVGPT